ncbi:MAG: hypothetical protein K2X27_06530 [Candidatus Obscuribacterales bacterium]|nr:hypothetical protein [Candidatus Obscuribacterales bacterium]
MLDAGKKKKGLRNAALIFLATGAVSTLMPAAFADYAECLGGARQTDTLRNPLVPGAPHAMPNQGPGYSQPPAVGDGSCPAPLIPGEHRGPTRVTGGYADHTYGSIFPASGSQGAKVPYGYYPGAGRYPTQNGQAQGMYDWGQGARYGKNVYEYGSSNVGIPTYEPGMELYGQRKYDWGQGLYGQQTYQSGAGNYGNRTYESGGKLNGVPTYDTGAGNYGQRSYDYGQGLAGQQTYQGNSGNYGQRSYDYGAENSGMSTYDYGTGNGGARKYDNGGGNYGQRTYQGSAGNGGTQLYSGAGRGGEATYEQGKGNGGKKQNEGGAGNGGTKSNDFGTEASGSKITNNGGSTQGAVGKYNAGGPRSNAEQMQDTQFAHGKQGNNYDFQGPLPTVRTFSRYLVILGVVFACVFVAMAGISVVMGNRNGPDRVIGAVAGLLLLLGGYTIWKIVQMNTFHANTTGVFANVRGEQPQRQQNGKVNPPQTFAPPEDPGQTDEAPKAQANQIEQRQRGQSQPYRPTNSPAPRMTQGPYNYRPQGNYSGHPMGPDRVGSFRIPSQGQVPEPYDQNVINPNKF